MKMLTNVLLAGTVALAISGCAGKSYIGKVDVLGVGAGPQVSASDPNYIDSSMLSDIVVAYTPKLQIKEQDVGKNVKYVAGDALVKEYSGEPKLLADYLNSYQSMTNKILILDKNGVVAWSGYFKGDIKSSQGVYDYGITGVDRMPFDEAMEKFVIDGDEADFDEEKTIAFPKGNKESLLSGFSYSKKYPLLFTKLPDMKVTNAQGQTISTQELSNNGKPTVLILYMSKGKEEASLTGDVQKVRDVVDMFSGRSAQKAAKPQQVLTDMQQNYFSK